MSTWEEIRMVSQAVLEKSKYSQISPELVERLAKLELEKGRNFKEAVKTVSGKLHQVGGAYLSSQPRYAHLHQEIKELPGDLQADQSLTFCHQVMQLHSSTRERLTSVAQFFNETLKTIAPIYSILDLACGLNPLALAWMPVAKTIQYDACDIYADMVHFMDTFLNHFHIPGRRYVCDLLNPEYYPPVQVAFLLKTLPCLEQLEKGIHLELLEKIPAEAMLISYPIYSLGGRSKGMRKNYEKQFNELISGKNWQVQRFEFANELAFLVRT